MKGTAWKFGNDIDTDIIVPGRYLIYTDEERLSQHCMEGLDDEFNEKCKLEDKERAKAASQEGEEGGEDMGGDEDLGDEGGESPEDDEAGGLDAEMLGDVQPESSDTTQA